MRFKVLDYTCHSRVDMGAIVFHTTCFLHKRLAVSLSDPSIMTDPLRYLIT